MKAKTIVFLLTLLPIFLMGQENPVKIGIQGGAYTAAEMENIQPGRNLSIDIGYFLSKRFVLTTHVNYGWNRYYEDRLTNLTDFVKPVGDGTNADCATIHVGLMIGYSLPITDWLNFMAYTGISTFTKTKEYPFQYEEWTFAPAYRSVTSLAFPVRAGLGVSLLKNLELACVGGFYVEPDYPIVGMHIGPQVSYRF